MNSHIQPIPNYSFLKLQVVPNVSIFVTAKREESTQWDQHYVAHIPWMLGNECWRLLCCWQHDGSRNDIKKAWHFWMFLDLSLSSSVQIWQNSFPVPSLELNSHPIPWHLWHIQDLSRTKYCIVYHQGYQRWHQLIK